MFYDRIITGIRKKFQSYCNKLHHLSVIACRTLINGKSPKDKTDDPNTPKTTFTCPVKCKQKRKEIVKLHCWTEGLKHSASAGWAGNTSAAGLQSDGHMTAGLTTKYIDFAIFCNYRDELFTSVSGFVCSLIGSK